MKAHGLVALASAVPYAIAASGGFNVLSYNIAGIPQWLHGNGITGGKDNAVKLIGQEFAAGPYDVIHVQEDFDYHRELYKNDNHTFRTKTSGNVLFGSGLNTLSNFNFTDFDRITWDRCSFNEGDCWTPKGFTYMRMSIAEGVTIDFYNLHAEAGNKKHDLEARQSNMEQLADYMESASAGQAVIVFGDTNSLYSSKEDNIRTLGLSDAWVENHYGGVVPTNAPYCHDGPTDPVDEDPKCEALDKVLYKSGDGVSLNATSHAYVTERFLQEDGHRLSDHNPVSVDFLWST